MDIILNLSDIAETVPDARGSDGGGIKYGR